MKNSTFTYRFRLLVNALILCGALVFAANAYGQMPSFVTDTPRHWSVGQADYWLIDEVSFFIVVGGMPVRTNNYGIKTPHLIEIRRLLPDTIPSDLPLLRVLWDEEGDGVSDFAAEVVGYDEWGNILWGPPVFLRLPMDSTPYFRLSRAEKT